MYLLLKLYVIHSLGSVQARKSSWSLPIVFHGRVLYVLVDSGAAANVVNTACLGTVASAFSHQPSLTQLPTSDLGVRRVSVAVPDSTQFLASPIRVDAILGMPFCHPWSSMKIGQVASFVSQKVVTAQL